MVKLDFKTNPGKNLKIFYTVIFLTGTLFVLTFSSNPAFAVNPTTVCDTTNTICLSYGASSYFVDNGALIILKDPTKAGVGSITITSSAPSVSGSAIYVTLLENPASSGIFSGYEYFNDNSEYPNTDPNNTIQSPRMSIGTLGSGVLISAYYTLPSGYSSSGGGNTAYLVPQTTVSSSIVDISGIPWPWPTLNANTQPSPLIMGCESSEDIGDHICKSWKIPSSDPGSFHGLRVPWTTDGTLSTTNFYQYQCDPSLAAGGMLVDTTGIDPQCPSPTDNVKDLYVEVDYLVGQKPNVNSLNTVAHIFLDHGIRLHIQLDEQIPFHRDSLNISPESIGAGSGTSDFDLIKQYYFGTSADRNNPTDSSGYGYQPNLTAKKNAFHYLLFVHSQDPSNLRSSGASEIPGNDMTISLGRFTGGTGSLDDISGTFMHELGHNLGLDHGGNETKNCKPNYISAMNYLYQLKTVISSRPLDFSHGEQATLDENHLDEFVGVGSSSRNNWIIAYGYNPLPSQPYYPGHFTQYGKVGSGIDFDDAMIGFGNPPATDHDISANISNVVKVGGCSSSVADSNMYDYDDWGNLNFDMKNTSAWTGGFTNVNLENFKMKSPPSLPGANFTSYNPYQDFLRLLSFAHSTWQLNWIQANAVDYHVKVSTTHYDITTDDVKELRSLQVTSLRLPIDSLPASAFHDQNDEHVLDNDIIIANDLGRKWDLTGATIMLERTKSDATSMIVDATARQQIIEFVDNAIGSHLSALNGYSAPNSTKTTSTTTLTFVSPSVPVSSPTVVTVKVLGLSPSGTVSFSSDSKGTFNPTFCTIKNNECSVTYTPLVLENGAHTISATYHGDTNNQASSNTAVLKVSTSGTVMIPSWIKNNAKWWSEGYIGDSDFIKGIQYMIQNGIIKIPSTTQGQATASTQIPIWIKNTAQWWSEGTVDDKTFASGIQYLITTGVIVIPS